jgi:photosystem II stability/assembly factor-like uncharacterized protein
VKVKIRSIAKFCAIALAICVLSPISASGYGTKLDNGRDWYPLSDAMTDGTQGVATSGDGRIVYALEYRNVRFSDDGGVTWSDRGAGIDWTFSAWDLATSLSGQYVVITQNGGYIFTSNDYGRTWVKKTNVVGGCWARADGQWRRTSMSYSGQYQVVMENCGTIFVSSNYGGSFQEKIIDPSLVNQDVFADVEISGAGSRIIIPTDSRIGKVYLSTNFGASFSEITALSFAKEKNWTTVEVSGDGMTLLACAAQDNIWTSRDGGTTWRESVVAGGVEAKDWLAATISYDGTNIGIGRAGTILTSSNGGQAWEARPGSPESRWVGIASSQDGFIMYANGGGSSLYRSDPTWIWYDSGTVTFFLPICGNDASKNTSISASSVKLEVDTLTAAANSDGATYTYFTETDTALWGATYDYGETRDPICQYSALDGNVIIERTRFISSSPRHSETTTNTTDFIQFVGGWTISGPSGYMGSPCGNLARPHAASVTTSCTPGILADYQQLSQYGMADWRDSTLRAGVLGLQSGLAYTAVKVRKSAIAGAPPSTTFSATETFTLTSV